MKGRSNRLPAPSAASEDWGDGSWTVDCSCGVTFDDGEEMVNCDLCGVWVHTRCSRYVKSEVSFACDKCKGRKRQRASSVGPPAESNGNSHAVNGGFAGVTNTEETEVAQLLAELPTKTDHCPPSASHRPPSFKLWTRAPIEERVHIQGVPGGDPSLFKGLSSVFTSELWKCTGYVAKKFNFKYKEFPCWEEDDDGENPTNRGADLLFSLSKDVAPRFPVESFEYGEIQKKLRKDRKIQENGAVIAGRSQTHVKKERSKIRETGVSSGKRKESSGIKDLQGAKKKSRTSVDKTSVENRRKDSLSRDEGSKPNIDDDDSLKTASEAGKDGMISEAISSNLSEGPVNNSKPKNDSANEVPLQKHLVELPPKLEVCDELVSPKIEISPKISAGGPVKEEMEDSTPVVNGEGTSNKENGNSGDMDEISSCSPLKSEKQTAGSGDMRSNSDAFVGPAVKHSTSVSQISSQIKIEEETTGQDCISSDQSQFPSSVPKEHLCKNAEVNGEVKGSPSRDDKLQERDMNHASGVVDLKNRGIDSSTREKVGECPSLPIPLAKHEERVKSVPVSSACSASAESKPVPSAAKSTQKVNSVSGTTCRSPASITSSTTEKAITKEKIKVKNSDEVSKEVTKQLTKSYSKNSHSSRSSQSFTKHTLTESKEKRAQGEEKSTSLESSRKTEKISLPISHLSSSSFNNSLPGINASSALSDEELARLLHQELNSSPRVPRVPRMRQPEGFHSSSGGTSTSMLSKCSGGKDHIQVSRRKNKEDSLRDRSRSSYALGGETRRGDRLSHPGSWPKTVSLDSAASQARTLPGLIDEIMSKGYCTTYEELCSAVLPYWKNLRKPNGDKYAYSSHSQAVLDCLRNRGKWAHLIDRIPKTNSSRKRSGPGAESNPDDSSTEDDQLDDSHSRNRRRLVLRGRVLRNQGNPSGSLASSSSDESDRRRLGENSSCSDSD